MTSPAPLFWPQKETAVAAPGPALLVTPEKVAARLGVTTALTDAQRGQITEAILDVQAQVEAELGRPLFAEPRTLTGMSPAWGARDLLLAVSWPTLALIDDRVSVVSATAAGDGTYTLEILVGLDGPNTRPVVQYVAAAAAEALRVDSASSLGSRAVLSVSAEGQSLTYEQRSTTEGAAGALPTLKSLHRYKRMSVFRRRTYNPPFGYGGRLPT